MNMLQKGVGLDSLVEPKKKVLAGIDTAMGLKMLVSFLVCYDTINLIDAS